MTKAGDAVEFSILVVEDVRSTSAMVCGVLRLSGFAPGAVFTGGEALTWIDRNPIDLLLLDYQLPDMTALELLNKIEAGGRQIPFIIMSGLGDEKIAVETMKRGALDYIVKENSFLEHLPKVVRQVAARVETENRLKAAQSELIHSEGRLAAFARALPDDAYVLDQNGFCVEVLSTTKEEAAGIASTGLRRGQTLEEYFSAENARILMQALRATVREGRMQLVEYPVILPDREHWFEGRFSPVGDAEIVSSMAVFVCRDITDRKEAELQRRELEKQLLQSQKMQAIGTLAGGIAHDFNNILSAILGYTEISHDQLPPESSTAANLKEVLRAGHRAKDLVRQILEFSRQPDHERRPVLISALVKETVRLAQATLPAGIEVRLDLEPQNGNVLANAAQIHQVIMNLLNNAEHAIGENGGIIKIGVDIVEIDRTFASRHPGLEEGRFVRLRVADNGQGMDRKIVARIFEPYFTTKAIDQGTGLGLSIVHGIVTAHRGTVSVESEPGRGSTFTVFLPQCDETAEEEPFSHDSIPRGQEHILLVDDEPVLGEMCRQMLEHLGYQVTTRSSGIEALEAFKASPSRYDLLLTDFAMPSLDGLELARRVRSVRPDLPVILITGFSRSRFVDRAYSAGVGQVIMKPIIARDLAHAVRAAFDGT